MGARHKNRPCFSHATDDRTRWIDTVTHEFLNKLACQYFKQLNSVHTLKP